MAINNPKELFIMLLSDVWQGTQRTAKIYQELGQLAQDADVKEALEARVFLSDKILSTLNEVFRLIGEKPVKTNERLHELFIEDFRKELAEIKSPEAKRLFVLARATGLAHLRIAEYKVLIAAADLTGHYAVGVLLESCLADKLAFIERTRRIIQERVKQKFMTA